MRGSDATVKPLKFSRGSGTLRPSPAVPSLGCACEKETAMLTASHLLVESVLRSPGTLLVGDPQVLAQLELPADEGMVPTPAGNAVVLRASSSVFVWVAGSSEVATLTVTTRLDSVEREQSMLGLIDCPSGADRGRYPRGRGRLGRRHRARRRPARPGEGLPERPAPLRACGRRPRTPRTTTGLGCCRRRGHPRPGRRLRRRHGRVAGRIARPRTDPLPDPT